MKSTLLAQNIEGGDVSFYDLNDAIFDIPSGQAAPEICINNPSLPFCGFVTDGYRIRFGSPGAIISSAIPYLFAIAGLILFVMIVWGGLEIMMGATNPKSAESGKQRITAAIVGFFILFSVFWIGQIIQIIFGLNIGLGGWGN